MHLLLRAMINGFGWKLGVELGRYVTKRLRLDEDDDGEEEDKDGNNADREPERGPGQPPPEGEPQSSHATERHPRLHVLRRFVSGT